MSVPWPKIQKERIEAIGGTSDQSLYFWWNFGCFTGYVGPPDHQIRVGRNPDYGSQKGDHEETFASGCFGVGQGEPKGKKYRRDQQICDSLLARTGPGHVQGFWFVFDIVVSLKYEIIVHLLETADVWSRCCFWSYDRLCEGHWTVTSSIVVRIDKRDAGYVMINCTKLI